MICNSKVAKNWKNFAVYGIMFQPFLFYSQLYFKRNNSIVQKKWSNKLIVYESVAGIKRRRLYEWLSIVCIVHIRIPYRYFIHMMDLNTTDLVINGY